MHKIINEMTYQSTRKVELLYDGEHKGFSYFILSLGTHPTAYVRIPRSHKLYGKKYDDIDIDVHGGLTYSSNDLMDIETDDWFIGWDYAHVGDYAGYDESLPEFMRSNNDKKWTVEEIIKDCESVIDQVINM